MDTLQRIWVGTGLNIVVNITAEGFSMHDDDFSITFECGRKSIVLTKDELVENEDGTFVAFVDTSKLSSGVLRATTVVHIADSNWEAGYRVEINKQDLFRLVL